MLGWEARAGAEMVAAILGGRVGAGNPRTDRCSRSNGQGLKQLLSLSKVTRGRAGESPVDIGGLASGKQRAQLGALAGASIPERLQESLLDDAASPSRRARAAWARAVEIRGGEIRLTRISGSAEADGSSAPARPA